MAHVARFLHITDTHLHKDGTAFKRDDLKVDADFGQETRESAVRDTLSRLAERLVLSETRLDGVIFCGDALTKSQPGGAQILLNLLLEHLGPLGIAPDRIVAVPGNHDIPVGDAKDATVRYADFIRVWRDAGCKTPWLDGIDEGTADYSRHILFGPEKQWMVMAVNSCHWSQIRSVKGQLADIWDTIPELLAKGDAALEQDFKEQLSRVGRYDMARLSPQQLEALRVMLRKVPSAKSGKQLRMVALHHHLRAPSHAEEVKAFADFSNLEQIRTFLAQQDFKVLLHGHKHESRLHFDFVELEGKTTPHRMLMVAGASFSAEKHDDPMRIIDVEGLPWVPHLRLEALPVPRPGLEQTPDAPNGVRLWEMTESFDRAPIVIQGSDFDDVYARVRKAAEDASPGHTVVAQLDMLGQTELRLPAGYPTDLKDEVERAEWLNSLVTWWQRPSSQLQGRIPYIHGTRLRRNGLDQVERIKELLKVKQTSRAIAVLIDPTSDFKEGPEQVEFASFCMVQFIKADLLGGTTLSCIAYYRAQEMAKWWPINVAELNYLLKDVAKAVGGVKLGRITTITPIARLTAKSPSHVAMPSIDRWLDQSPEKFFVLATALLNGEAGTDRESKALREWIAACKELAKFAIVAPADGGPVVAIEGPRCLATYLECGDGANVNACKTLAATLKDISRAGMESPKNHNLLENWGQALKKKLEEVISTCEAVLASDLG